VAVGGGFDETAAISTRAVIVASWLGAAVLIGARWPLARVFESHDAHGASVLALALAAFAPGLVGYGISANLSRVLFALGRLKAAGLGLVAGPLLRIVISIPLVKLWGVNGFGIASVLALVGFVWQDRQMRKLATYSMALTILVSFSLTGLITRALGRVGMIVVIRVLGLILCAMAVQIIIIGVAASTHDLIRHDTAAPYPAAKNDS